MTRNLALAAALTILALPLGASAKRIAVMEFEGAGHGTVQVAIARALRAEHTVIPRLQVRTRLAELGLMPRCAREEMVGIASAIGAEAILCGSMRGTLLTVEIFNGGDGRLLRTLRLRVPRQGLSLKVLARVGVELGTVVAGAWAWEAVPVGKPRSSGRRSYLPERSTMASLPETSAWDGDTENPLSRARSRRQPEEAVVSRPSAAARAEGQHALRVGLGPAMLLRRNYRVYGATNKKDGQGWTTNPVAGLALSAEIYPAAWFSKGWASHLGIGASFARYFGPSWRFSESLTDQNASHQVFAFDVRGRFTLWNSPRALELMVRAGYRRVDSQMHDLADQPAAIPDASLAGLETGLALRLPILPRWLQVHASFDYLPVFDRGEIASESEYGSASGGGMLFGGGLRGDFYASFGWQLDVEYAWYTHSFESGSAARYAETARDRYLTAVLQLTFRN